MSCLSLAGEDGPGLDLLLFLAPFLRQWFELSEVTSVRLRLLRRSLSLAGWFLVRIGGARAHRTRASWRGGNKWVQAEECPLLPALVGTRGGIANGGWWWERPQGRNRASSFRGRKRFVILLISRGSLQDSASSARAAVTRHTRGNQTDRVTVKIGDGDHGRNAPRYRMAWSCCHRAGRVARDNRKGSWDVLKRIREANSVSCRWLRLLVVFRGRRHRAFCCTV